MGQKKQIGVAKDGGPPRVYVECLLLRQRFGESDQSPEAAGLPDLGSDPIWIRGEVGAY